MGLKGQRLRKLDKTTWWEKIRGQWRKEQDNRKGEDSREILRKPSVNTECEMIEIYEKNPLRKHKKS